MARKSSRTNLRTSLSVDLIQHYRQLSQNTFTVVDVETTGHRAAESRVIEISVLQANLTDGILHQQSQLINPKIPIPLKIAEFTGITSAMVAQEPTAEQVFPNYWPLLNQHILTAHNLLFDYSFLQGEAKRLGTSFQRPADQKLCTVELSRLMLADLPSRSLPKLVKHFQFPVGRSHRAEADTQACWFLLERLLTDIQQDSDQSLIQRFGQQWIRLQDAAKLLRCSSSKAKKLLSDTPSRQSRQSNVWLYRRRDVEAVFWQSEVRSEEIGSRSEEIGARSEEIGARSEEIGARSEEPGARSEEPGARSEEPGDRSEEPGAKIEQLSLLDLIDT